ncbi:MAG: D-alanine--D-alanine ligase [Planctomycetes bacterium]|nr:D-alanine--D-alanine ligase [Planctomycetota bacterium]
MKPRRIALAFDATLECHPGEAPTHDDIRGTVEAVGRALTKRGYETVPLPVTRPGAAKRLVAKAEPDVVFNLVEGLEGDSSAEAAVARELEASGVAYTGCPAGSIDLALDKERTKVLLSEWGLPVPQGRVMEAPESADGLRFPLIVKCLREDASIGLTDRSIVRDEAQLREQVMSIIETYQQPAIVEEFLEGREFNIAVAGPRPAALPISEIDFSAMPAGKPRFVSYDAKWVPESVEYRATVPICPAKIQGPSAARLQRLAVRAFLVAGCRDVARIDIRTDATGKPFILEINPNPDLSPDAGLARAACAHGWTWEGLVERLALWAWRRSSRAVDRRSSRPSRR